MHRLLPSSNLRETDIKPLRGPFLYPAHMTPSPLIAEDPAILGGVPCFAGTRVPIEHVLASLDKGVSLELLQSSWPFLTEAHIQEARRYVVAKLHPLPWDSFFDAAAPRPSDDFMAE